MLLGGETSGVSDDLLPAGGEGAAEGFVAQSGAEPCGVHSARPQSHPGDSVVGEVALCGGRGGARVRSAALCTARIRRQAAPSPVPR